MFSCGPRASAGSLVCNEVVHNQSVLAASPDTIRATLATGLFEDN